MSEHKPIGAFDSQADRVRATLPNDPQLPHNNPKKSNWWEIIIGTIIVLLGLAYLIFGTSCQRVESTKKLSADSLEIARRDTVFPYQWPYLQTDQLCIVGDTMEPSLSPAWFEFYKDSITIKERPGGLTHVKLVGKWQNKRQFLDNRCELLFVQILSPLEITIKADETWYKFSVSQ